MEVFNKDAEVTNDDSQYPQGTIPGRELAICKDVLKVGGGEELYCLPQG